MTRHSCDIYLIFSLTHNTVTLTLTRNSYQDQQDSALFLFVYDITLITVCKMDIFIFNKIFVIILEFQHRHGHGHCDFKYNRVNKVRTLTENLLYHTASYTNNSSATFHIGLCKWREHHINLIYNYISTAFLHNIIRIYCHAAS